MSNETKAPTALNQEQQHSEPEDSDTSIGNIKSSRSKRRIPKAVNKIRNSLPRVQNKNKQNTIQNVSSSTNEHFVDNNNRNGSNLVSFPSPSASKSQPESGSNINRGLKKVNGRKSKKLNNRQIDNSSNGHNTNSVNSNNKNKDTSSTSNNVNRDNGTVINYRHNQNNINISNNHHHHHPLVRGPDHFNKLIESFGCPDNVSDFNLMAIAGVLQEGQHIHKNRELKAQIDRFRKKIDAQQKDIDSLKEQAIVYKKKATEVERLEIQKNKLMKLNKKMLDNWTQQRKEVHKLRVQLRDLRQQSMKVHFKPIQIADDGHNGDNNDDNDNSAGLIPLPIDDENDASSPPNTNILAPNNDNSDNRNIKDTVLQPLPASSETNENETDNKVNEDNAENEKDEENGPRQVSAYVRNQRLIALTGDQTYMTAHQKVIRDPNSRSKSHVAYQRKDTFKATQQDNKTLREQIVKLTQELHEATNGNDKTVDGVTAEHLKKQLKECRKALELEKKVNSKIKSALNTKGDEESLKEMLAQKSAELTRLMARYEASKERVEKLAKERDQYKTLADTKHKENTKIREQTQAMIEKTKEHIVKTKNEAKHWQEEAMKLGRSNRKLNNRDSKEEELEKEIVELKKKNKHSQSEVNKYKKRYKDLKLQIDTAGPGNLTLRSRNNRPRGRPRKNEQSIYVSTDSSDKEEIEATVDFLQALDDAEKKSNDSVGNHNNYNEKMNKKKLKKPYKKSKYQKGAHNKKSGFRNNFQNGGYGNYKKNWNNNAPNTNSNGNSSLNDILRKRGNRDTSNNNNTSFAPHDNINFEDIEDLDWSDDDDDNAPILAGGSNNSHLHNNQHQVKLPDTNMNLNGNSNNGQKSSSSFFAPPPSDAAFIDVPNTDNTMENGESQQPDNDLMSYRSMSSPIQIEVPSVGSIDIDTNMLPNNATTNTIDIAIDTAIDTVATDTYPLQNDHDNNIMSKIENDTNLITHANNNNNTNNMNTDNQNDADDDESDDDFYDAFNTNPMANHLPTTTSNSCATSQPIQQIQTTQPKLNSAFAEVEGDTMDNTISGEPSDGDLFDNQPHTDDDTESLFNLGAGTTSPNLAALSNKHQNPFNTNSNTNTINNANANHNNVAALALQDVDNHEAEPANSNGPRPLFGNVYDDSEGEHSDLSNVNIQSSDQLEINMDSINHDKKIELSQMPDPGDSEEDNVIVPISKNDTVSFDVEVGLKVDNDNDDREIKENENEDEKENENEDESDDDAPILANNGPIDKLKVEGNAPIKSEQQQDDEDDLRAILSNDAATSNNRKRQREENNDKNPNQQEIIIEPVAKKRKLEQIVSVNDSTDHFDVDDDLNDLDDFDQFMAADSNNNNNSNNTKIKPDIKQFIPSSLSAPPSSTSSHSKDDVSSKKIPVKIENTGNNDININTNCNQNESMSSLPFSKDYINNQFKDWKAEFRFMITQKHDHSMDTLIDGSVHSILCRWKYPQIVIDKKNSSKEVADNIIQIVINECFDEIFTGTEYFDEKNKSIYLSKIQLFGKIIQKLTRSKSTPNLLSQINKRLRKIIHKEKGSLAESIKFGPKIYFCGGLLSLLCRLTKNEGFFWRSVIQAMDVYELWQSAEIFAIMFECYPEQITAHKTAFVQNCFKCIFLGHSHSISKKADNDDKFGDISKIKQCYQRLMNVVKDDWNYMNESSKDKLIQQQINNTISKKARDENINSDCQTGILLICACDIRYATNHFLPKILYPIIFQQFGHQNPVIQVFLLQLYYDCCTKIFKRLSHCKQPQALLIKNNICTIMTTLLSLSVASSINGNNLIDPSVTIFCFSRLYQLKNNSYLQLIIQDNVNSEQQLLQFATQTLGKWKQQLNKINNVSAKKSKQQLLFGMINILDQIFKQKQYQSIAWSELKNLYKPQNKKNQMFRK